MNKKRIIILSIISIIIIIAIIIGVIKIAPRYNNPYSQASDKVSLIVGKADRTDDVINEIVIDGDKILLSYEDMKRFIDAYIQKDEKYNQIITNSKIHTKVIDIENMKMREFLDDKWEDVYIKQIGDTIYFDINQLQEIYGIDVKYVKEINLVKISKDIHTYTIGNIAKDTKLKYLPSGISATIDTLEKNSEVYVLKEDKEYYKVLDSLGRFGYVIKSDVENIQDKTNYVGKKYDKNLSILWEYVNQTVPNTAGETKLEGVNILSPTLIDLLDENANVHNKVDKNYLVWAKNVGYDVWVMFSNNSKKESTNKILNDSKLREKLISTILDICVKNSITGINVDFENMYKADKDAYSQFIREITVALHNLDIFVSVNVTVPDGSDNWSLCYDRKALGEAADYVVLMGYDQTSAGGNKAGSTAAKNWVEKNIKKLLDEVDNEKLVLGIPLYMRVWTQTNDKLTSSIVNMKDVNNYIRKYLGENVEKQWLENEGQYYIEKDIGNKVYKLWIEDTKSIEEKLKLFKQYDLAGIAAWEKGRDDKDIWNLINKYI